MNFKTCVLKNTTNMILLLVYPVVNNENKIPNKKKTTNFQKVNF